MQEVFEILFILFSLLFVLGGLATQKYASTVKYRIDWVDTKTPRKSSYHCYAFSPKFEN